MDLIGLILPIIVLISSVLLSSHSRPTGSPLSPQSPKTLNRIIDDYYDAYAKKDRARMLAFYADDVLFEDPTANLRAVGKTELVKLYDSIAWDDYADLSWKFEGRIFAADRVALEGTVSGKYRSKPFSMRIATILIFQKGKIVHHLDLVDYAALKEQMKIGVVTPLTIQPRRAQLLPDRFVKLDGMRVHYQSYGEGREVLVFVHGLTCDLSFWKGQIPAFEQRTRVIVIDLPGHGRSDKPQTAYTMDLFARAVDAVMRDASVGKAVLVGHSMGAPVIRQFYRKFPHKTRALVIVDGPLRLHGDTATLEKFLDQFRGPNYQATWAELVSSQLRPVKDQALREELKAKMLSAPQHVTVSAMEGIIAPQIWQSDQIKVPVLAVLAKLPNWPADNEQSFRGIAPDLDYQMWEGVSHFLMVDKPQEFNEALLTFLKKKGLIKG